MRSRRRRVGPGRVERVIYSCCTEYLMGPLSFSCHGADALAWVGRWVSCIELHVVQYEEQMAVMYEVSREVAERNCLDLLYIY